MVKRAQFTVFAVLASMLFAGAALAQVDWLVQPPFEVQRDVYWDFEEPNPMEPEYFGPDDDELKESDFMEWEGIDFFEGKIGIDNRGGDGPREGWVYAHLDNWERDLPEKLIWFQWRLFQTEGTSWQGWWDFPDGYQYDAELVAQKEHEDGSVTYCQAMWVWRNPPWEEIGADFAAEVGGLVWVDDLRVATACVPEPGLIGLVGLGLLGLLARRRK